MTRVLVAIGLVALLGAAAVAAPKSAISQQDREAAKKAYLHAIDLYKQGKYPQAAAELRKVYSLVPLPAVLFNLGVTYAKMGNRQGARAALSEYLKEMPNAPNRADAQRLLQALEEADAQGAQNQEQAAATPPPSEKAEEEKPQTEKDVEDPLSKQALRDTRSRARDVEEHGENRPSYGFWKWTTAALGAGGVVAGILLLKRAGDQESALFGASTARPDGSPSRAYDQSVRAVEDGYTSNKTWGTVALISGSALVATSVLLFVLDHRASSSERAHVAPSLGPSFAGVTARGSF